MDTATRLEASARQRNITLFMVLIITLAAAVLIWMAVAKRITLPIVMLTDAAEKMSMGDLSMKINTIYPLHSTSIFLSISPSFFNQIRGHYGTRQAIRFMTRQVFRNYGLSPPSAQFLNGKKVLSMSGLLWSH
jgi:methyl-accepting chemotaxis protein